MTLSVPSSWAAFDQLVHAAEVLGGGGGRGVDAALSGGVGLLLGSRAAGRGCEGRHRGEGHECGAELQLRPPGCWPAAAGGMFRAEPRRAHLLGGYSRVTCLGTTDERAVWPASAVLPPAGPHAATLPSPRSDRGLRRVRGRHYGGTTCCACSSSWSRWSSASTASSRPSRRATTRSATCPRCGGSCSSCSSRSSGRSPGSSRAGRSVPPGGTAPTSAARARSPSTTVPAGSRPPTPPPTRRS